MMDVAGAEDAKLMRALGVDAETLAKFKRVREGAIADARAMGKPRTGKIRVLGVSGSARDSADMAAEDSNSEELLKRCLSHCEKLGAETELLPLRNYRIEHCKACYSTVNTQCHFYCSCYPKGESGDDMTNVVYDKLLAADAILFATPVNNFKISTLMSAFIDRCISMDGSLSPADPQDPKNRELNVKHMKFIEMTSDNAIPGSGLLRRFPGKIAGIIVTGHEEGASMAISQLFLTLNNFGMLFPPFSHVYAMSSICKPTYEDKPLVTGDCYSEEVRMLAENVIRAARLARAARPTDWEYDCRAN